MENNTYYFECVTAYDKEAVTHYTTYHYRHVDRRGPVRLLLAGGLFLALAVWQFLSGSFLKYVFLFLGAMAVIVGVNMFTGKASIKVPEGENGQPVLNRQRFFEDRVEYAGPQSQGFNRYDQITRIGEDQGYFFLYLQNNQALVVQKSAMTLGTAEELRRFLQVKVPGWLK